MNSQYSKHLLDCMNNCSKLQLNYYSDFEENFSAFYIPRYRSLGYCVYFDPWTGREVSCLYDYELVETYESGMQCNKERWEESGMDIDLHNYELNERELNDFLGKFGPVDSKTNRKYCDHNIKKGRDNHLENVACEELSWLLKGGVEEYLTPIIHIPNIRTYAILNKKEYGGFESMNYCPFCGAKFPDRLDEKLTEILRREYGLNSWKDYKKAPPEFQTDEWWKKRGL